MGLANINSETIYWLLSTFAQTYAALIAILGALTAFRLQLLSNLRGTVRARLVEPFSNIVEHAYSLSSKQMIELWNSKTELIVISPCHHQLVPYTLIWNKRF